MLRHLTRYDKITTAFSLKNKCLLTSRISKTTIGAVSRGKWEASAYYRKESIHETYCRQTRPDSVEMQQVVQQMQCYSHH